MGNHGNQCGTHVAHRVEPLLFGLEWLSKWPVFRGTWSGTFGLFLERAVVKFNLPAHVQIVPQASPEISENRVDRRKERQRPHGQSGMLAGIFRADDPTRGRASKQATGRAGMRTVTKRGRVGKSAGESAAGVSVDR